MGNRIAIGMDIGGTSIKAGLVGEDGRIVHETVSPTRAFEGRNVLLDQIEAIAMELMEIARKQRLTLSGIGVGSAGYIDLSGSVGEATGNLPGWTGTRLKEEMQRRTGLPAAVDNDVNAMAAGELWQGAGRNRDNFICVSLGTGIGGSIVLNRKIHRGFNGFAGAFGHQTIVYEGRLCTCGLRGCWEQYASVTALKRLAKEAACLPAKEESTEAFFDRLQNGDPAAQTVLQTYSRFVATGLANLIHLFNPETIIIGGAITAQGDLLMNPIREHVKRCALSAFVKGGVEIVPAELGYAAGMVGAAKQALDL